VQLQVNRVLEKNYHKQITTQKYSTTTIETRSQAVARIADRTAKNCRGSRDLDRAQFRGKIFVRLLGIPNTKPPTKFEVSSSSSFKDMFDRMPKIVGVT